MGKSSGGGAKQQVNRYQMSIHLGICTQLDALTGIYIGEKEAWSGEVTAETGIIVDRQNLFGGDKKEGGVQGTAYFLPGGPTQVFPDNLAARRGLTSATSPAYRGLASIYFVGVAATAGISTTTDPVIGGVLGSFGATLRGALPSQGAGFYWGASPYIQTIWLRGRRAPKGLDPAYALIGNRLSVLISGMSVSVGTDTITVADGVATLVGGHTIVVSQTSVDGTKLYTIDGLQIEVVPYIVDDNGDHQAGTTATVDGANTGTLNHGTITLAGVTIAKSGDVLQFDMGSAGQDANPAGIIYECLVNQSWGMGETPTLVDENSFNAAAVVLFNEGFGLSLLWTRETTIEAFVGEILDHIQAALYIDPETGKFTLKLFRDDYDIATLPHITPDNAVLDNFQRKLWGETVNEISVTWTNPVNEQEETVTQQDLGNIVTQQATVADSRNYYAVRNAPLAQRLAIRDVRQSSAPLASADALLDRSSWNLRPGSVARLTWPEYELENLIVRVMNIDYGKVGAPSIVANLLEDIFSLERAAAPTPAESGAVDPSRAPTPMNHVRVITAPAYFTSRRLPAADVETIQYPEVLAAVLGASTNSDAVYYEMVGQTVTPNGTTVAQEKGTKGLLGYAALPVPLNAEAVTTIATFGAISNGVAPTVSGFVFIGDKTETVMEIALIESRGENGWVLQRGVLDTVPRKWPSGTALWFYDVRVDFFDQDNHSELEAVAYKLLTVTSRGKLSPAASPVYGATLSARPHLPTRPANVMVAGVAFGPVNLVGSSPSVVPVTWSTRNRTMEDGSVVTWTEAPITPEAGQTTKIKVVSPAGAVLATHSALAGNSFDIPIASFGSNFEADVLVSSARDGLESLQYVARRVRVAEDPVTPGSPIAEPGTPAEVPYVPPADYPAEEPPPNYGGGGFGIYREVNF